MSNTVKEPFEQFKRIELFLLTDKVKENFFKYITPSLMF